MLNGGHMALVIQHSAYKELIYFQRGERTLNQLQQRGVSGSEIIQRQLDTAKPQSSRGIQHFTQMWAQLGFCYLQTELLGWQAIAL